MKYYAAIDTESGITVGGTYNCAMEVLTDDTGKKKLLKLYTTENILKHLDDGFVLMEATEEPDSTKIVDDDFVLLSHFRCKSIADIDMHTIKKLINAGADYKFGADGYGLVLWAIMRNDFQTMMYLVAGEHKDYFIPGIRKYLVKIVGSKSMNPVSATAITHKGGSKFDVNANNSNLFLQAAAAKNTVLCEILLENGSYIPRQVYNMYSMNPNYHKDMQDLIAKYKDRVL
jgi:hypothetical protein